MACMLLSAGGTEFVRWWEVVRSSECALKEVPLYSYVLIIIVGLLLFVRKKSYNKSPCSTTHPIAGYNEYGEFLCQCRPQWPTNGLCYHHE